MAVKPTSAKRGAEPDGAERVSMVSPCEAVNTRDELRGPLRHAGERHRPRGGADPFRHLHQTGGERVPRAGAAHGPVITEILGRFLQPVACDPVERLEEEHPLHQAPEGKPVGIAASQVRGSCASGLRCPPVEFKKGHRWQNDLVSPKAIGLASPLAVSCRSTESSMTPSSASTSMAWVSHR
jgi:hypothetical protein